MYYITQANFSRIHAKSKHQIAFNGDNAAYLYPHRHIDWFNDQEVSRILLCTILLDADHSLHPKFMPDTGWEQLSTPADDFRMAIPPKAPAYHTHADCPALHSVYRNFELPVGLKERYGEKGVQQFRQWLHTPTAHGTPFDWLEDNANRFAAQVSAKWRGCKWHEAIESYRKHRNSGVKLFAYNDLAAIQQKIDQLLADFNAWLATLTPAEQHAVQIHKQQAWCHQERYWAKHSRSYHNHLSAEQVRILLAEFSEQFKDPMQNALLAYHYQQAIRSGLTTDLPILQQLGFTACDCQKQIERSRLQGTQQAA